MEPKFFVFSSIYPMCSCIKLARNKIKKQQTRTSNLACFFLDDDDEKVLTLRSFIQIIIHSTVRKTKMKRKKKNIPFFVCIQNGKKKTGIIFVLRNLWLCVRAFSLTASYTVAIKHIKHRHSIRIDGCLDFWTLNFFPSSSSSSSINSLECKMSVLEPKDRR